MAGGGAVLRRLHEPAAFALTASNRSGARGRRASGADGLAGRHPAHAWAGAVPIRWQKLGRTAACKLIVVPPMAAALTGAAVR
ncbi:hypothetical protein BOS5A_231385 [Bosea sp. EC-HK365B]|nr:hypothetical protein BOSE7B_50044 [Bosea sp. 7B]CAD5300413.1 hypothetical protein BOSE21B_91455 [Bosea sp. 21B]VVT62117.1 hypothetical protein BOS5A_231385 [Bosea sp. EC-HK365B]VXC96469.1 hypothetical protein BOSE127_90044 [Bosea sp. 127]